MTSLWQSLKKELTTPFGGGEPAKVLSCVRVLIRNAEYQRVCDLVDWGNVNLEVQDDTDWRDESWHMKLFSLFMLDRFEEVVRLYEEAYGSKVGFYTDLYLVALWRIGEKRKAFEVAEKAARFTKYAGIGQLIRAHWFREAGDQAGLANAVRKERELEYDRAFWFTHAPMLRVGE